MSVVSYITEHKSRLLSWGSKGGLAVLDQGLFSGANFLVNILLARWLEPKEYGAFAVALSVFYLLAGFHTAVLTEPMMVFGAGKYREQFRKYLGMLLYGHWGLSALIALLLAGAAFVMRNLDSEAMAQALAGLAIASPFLLLLWLTRRGCYVEMRPQWAVLGSAVNLVVVLGGLFLLWRAGLLSSLSGLVLLGAAAGIASLALTALHLRPRLLGFVGNPTPAMVLRDHWGYGSWNLIAVGIYWASGATMPIFVSTFLGLESTALLQAISTLFAPLNLLLQSSGLLLLPYFAKRVHANVMRDVRNIGLFLSLLSALYTLFVTVLYEPVVVPTLFAGKYTGASLYLIFLGINYAVSSFVYTVIAVVKAHEDTRTATTAWGLAAIVFTTFAIPSLLLGKLTGILIVLVLSTTGGLVWATITLKKSTES